MLFVPFFLILKILPPNLKVVPLPLQGRNSRQLHLKLMLHFLLAFILYDLGLDPRPSKWLRLFPLMSGTLEWAHEERIDKASSNSYYRSFEKKTWFWGLCVQGNHVTWMDLFTFWPGWEHTCYSAVSTHAQNLIHIKRNPSWYYGKKYKQVFGVRVDLRKDLSNCLCGIIVLNSLGNVNSLEVEDLSATILG